MLTTAPPDVRPFRISVPEAELADLRDRLARTRWPDDHDATGWSRGVPLAYLKALAEHWATSFDWRRSEERLNRHPQITTVVDGQTVHCMHVRSPEPAALPLVLLHGWPGSIAELLPVVGPLSGPETTGGDVADAFHVVVPSIPGFGFSTPLQGTGWSATRIAQLIAELMHRLGYRRYGVHGTDLGAGVAGALSAVDAQSVVGVHVASDPQTAVTFSMFTGDPASREGLTDAERQRVEAMKQAGIDDQGYLRIQTTRPQTLAYALTDSPAGQLAWIVEKFQRWTDSAAALPEQAVDRDLLLLNVTLYWLTRSGASSAHVLYDGMHAQDWAEAGGAPTGWAVFGSDSVTRKLLDPERTIEHWTEFDRGGHFPAMEVPDLLVGDLRKFFRPVR